MDSKGFVMLHSFHSPAHVPLQFSSSFGFSRQTGAGRKRSMNKLLITKSFPPRIPASRISISTSVFVQKRFFQKSPGGFFSKNSDSEKPQTILSKG
ncbi:hypothetical protein L596_011977 [Steinernema carpocapsae]|uniref:Uncharacterized protein n=1 Tax=Steinernema carpocapsae TaxID=34508 RepID=A0A4U5NWJ7_STECR|nr:hypothetical protein L596_011977 [Steinernema carpocapsae]